MSHKIVVSGRPAREPRLAVPSRADGDRRIDQAHSLAEEPSVAPAADIAAASSGAALPQDRPLAINPLAQLHTQARQLAAHLQEQREALIEREADLDQRQVAQAESEARVRDDAERLSGGWSELAAARQAHEQQVRHDRRAIADELARNEQDLARRRRDLDRREKEADSREAELRTLQERLREAEREVLEMRHASEELWGQIAAVLPPAAAQRTVARLRERLSESYRLAAADMEQRRSELAALLVRLEERHDSLTKRRSDILTWASRRQAELASQAERLALREEEVAEQEKLLAAARTRL